MGKCNNKNVESGNRATQKQKKSPTFQIKCNSIHYPYPINSMFTGSMLIFSRWTVRVLNSRPDPGLKHGTLLQQSPEVVSSHGEFVTRSINMNRITEVTAGHRALYLYLTEISNYKNRRTARQI
jgi:hypothetical protein